MRIHPLVGIFGIGRTGKPCFLRSSRMAFCLLASIALRFAHWPLCSPQLVISQMSPRKVSHPERVKLSAKPGIPAQRSSSARSVANLPSSVCSSSQEYSSKNAKNASPLEHPQSLAALRIACLYGVSTATFNHLAIISSSKVAGQQPSKMFLP